MSDKNTTRECWVDYAKLFACVLVVLGHLFQSFDKTGIINGAGALYTTFEGVIYLFHVPVFFFCSGYLYQKLSKVDSAESYVKSIWKKFLNLGIPYFTFTTITLGLKSLAGNNVASPVEYGFFSTMFLHPTSPYWFLYTLFFIFLVTPTINENSKIRNTISIIVVALVLKYTAPFLAFAGIKEIPFAVSSVMGNAIWFVLGMVCVSKNLLLFVNMKIASCLLIFFPLSIIYAQHNGIKLAGGGITILGIAMTVSWFFILDRKLPLQSTLRKVLNSISKYTMQIFLLHTICAAPIRVLLLKLGCNKFAMHLTFGVLTSFMLPIIIAIVAEKSKVLNVFFAPVRIWNRVFK